MVMVGVEHRHTGDTDLAAIVDRRPPFPMACGDSLVSRGNYPVGIACDALDALD
jgi:hypothetical protein